MNCKTVTITLAITLSLLVAACGARSFGGGPIGNNNNNLNNSNLNSNLNLNLNNTNSNSDLLNRGVMAVNTANSICGFDVDLGAGCQSQYDDVESYGNEEYLCWSVEILDDLEVDTSSSEDGMFLQNDPVMDHEMWEFVCDAEKFLPYRAECSRIIAEGEHQPYLGALCDKGMLSEYEPFEYVTMAEWSDLLHVFRLFHQQDAMRVYIYEVLLRTFVDMPDVLELECVPIFSDVEPNSFRCHVSNHTYNSNIGAGYADGTFGPDNGMNWPEFAKSLYSTLILMGRTQPIGLTGCFQHPDCMGENPGWFCEPMDFLCENGLLPEILEDLTTVPPLGDALHVIHESKLLF